MATLELQPIDFVRNDAGDQITTSRIVLDAGDLPVQLAARYRPVLEGWTCTVIRTDGTVVVSDALLNFLEDVFSNVVKESRPTGSIVPVTRDRTDPGRDAWTTGGRLYYVPGGVDDLWRELVELIA